MKKEQKQEWDANTVYSLYVTTPLPACIVYDCREGRGVIIGSVSISFLFPFFFHQSSLYPRPVANLKIKGVLLAPSTLTPPIFTKTNTDPRRFHRIVAA